MFSSNIYDFRIKINTTILSWINNSLRVVVRHMNGLADDTSQAAAQKYKRIFTHHRSRLSPLAHKNKADLVNENKNTFCFRFEWPRVENIWS